MFILLFDVFIIFHFPGRKLDSARAILFKPPNELSDRGIDFIHAPLNIYVSFKTDAPRRIMLFVSAITPI